MKHTGLGIGIATSPPSPELSGPGLPAATTFENDYDYYNGINDPFMLDGRCALCSTGHEILADWVIAPRG
jgi:hypothetical protein